MAERSPTVTVLAGPNGSGKTTTSAHLLRDYFDVVEFVNADTIAQGLSAFSVESVALAAGRIMLARLRELAALRVSFAFETTLAARTFAPWLRQLQANGYHFHLFFLWLPTPDLAISRVASRVQQGGHSIPCKRQESWWFYLDLGFHLIFALKGLNISAQGNALGRHSPPIT